MNKCIFTEQICYSEQLGYSEPFFYPLTDSIGSIAVHVPCPTQFGGSTAYFEYYYCKIGATVLSQIELRKTSTRSVAYLYFKPAYLAFEIFI